jgi:hypothetical protein
MSLYNGVFDRYAGSHASPLAFTNGVNQEEFDIFETEALV